MMPVDNRLLGAAALGVVLGLWAVGARRRIRRLRLAVWEAFPALDDVLSAQHGWIANWCSRFGDGRAPAPATDAWVQRLAASASQASLALRRLRRDPLDASAMAGLYQARQTLRAVLLAGASHVAATDDTPVSHRPWPPEDWGKLVQQEVRLAAAFNRRVAAYNAAVSQFPALFLAALLRHRKARGMDAFEPS